MLFDVQKPQQKPQVKEIKQHGAGIVKVEAAAKNEVNAFKDKKAAEINKLKLSVSKLESEKKD